MGDQPCVSGRSTLPTGDTREIKPPKKRCLLAPRWDYPEGTPNGGIQEAARMDQVILPVFEGLQYDSISLVHS
uniref:Negative regulator of P-body association n=1 Tax=Equus caballus TaxID=9796 RepID=A0A5F5PZN8_HORSE